jgi:UV DNA damage endonuclease
METMTPRVGYCCMFIPPDGDKQETKRMNVTSTTIAALTRMERTAAFDKVSAIIRHNIAALEAQLMRIGSLPTIERLFRFSSDLLPAYTHPVARWMYSEPAMVALITNGFGSIGALARHHDIRISMHPGQYCVLATVNEATLQNAVAEFEYHIDMMRWLGYAGGWHRHGAHVNIHVGSRAGGLARFRAALPLLSDDARGLITVENDEIIFGLDDVLTVADELPIVLDFHHHWIATQGQYLERDDPRIAQVIASWRGVRPVTHLSVSRRDLLPDHPVDQRPDFKALAETGLTVRDLRAHSDLMWNNALNVWVQRHLEWSDMEVEAKAKNIASKQIADCARSFA